MVTETHSITPVQSGVNRIINLLHEDEELMNDARWFAEIQLRDQGYSEQEIEKLRKEHEACEDTPIYNDYYKYLTLFQKRVVQATTAII